MGCGQLVDKLRWIINFFNIEGVGQYLICIILNYSNALITPKKPTVREKGRPW
jgi:hypothetical protein